MKGSVILILIALSLTASVVLQSRKNAAAHEDIDRIAEGLAGARKFIPTGSVRYFKTEPGNYELYPQARYVLAPALLKPMKMDADTLLAIQYIFTPDSTLSYTIAGRRLLWEYKDERYRYTLTTAH